MEEKELKNGYIIGICVIVVVKVVLEVLIYGKKVIEVDIIILNYINLKIFV